MIPGLLLVSVVAISFKASLLLRTLPLVVHLGKTALGNAAAFVVEALGTGHARRGRAGAGGRRRPSGASGWRSIRVAQAVGVVARPALHLGGSLDSRAGFAAALPHRYSVFYSRDPQASRSAANGVSCEGCHQGGPGVRCGDAEQQDVARWSCTRRAGGRRQRCGSGVIVASIHRQQQQQRQANGVRPHCDAEPGATSDVVSAAGIVCRFSAQASNARGNFFL
jgi:hypothetical protein